MPRGYPNTPRGQRLLAAAKTKYAAAKVKTRRLKKSPRKLAIAVDRFKAVLDQAVAKPKPTTFTDIPFAGEAPVGFQTTMLKRVKLGPSGEIPDLEFEVVRTESMVNHPKHYNKHPARLACSCGRTVAIECIDVIEHMPANVAMAIKHLWRIGLKWDGVEDAQKAAWYCNREAERLEMMLKANANEDIEKLGKAAP